MKLTTTFWSDQVHEFDKLLYINGNTQEIMFQTDLNNVFETYNFFKSTAKFVKSPMVRKTIDNNGWNNEDYYQFAVLFDNKITHIKWFDLVVNDKLTLSHDIAFETTLIKKNGQTLPFGHFPMWYYNRNINLPKYREFNLKARAYKYLANLIRKESF